MGMPFRNQTGLRSCWDRDSSRRQDAQHAAAISRRHAAGRPLCRPAERTAVKMPCSVLNNSWQTMHHHVMTSLGSQHRMSRRQCRATAGWRHGVRSVVNCEPTRHARSRGRATDHTTVKDDQLSKFQQRASC